jgi:hypothetical protein
LGRLSLRYGFTLFLVLIAGSAAGTGLVHAFNLGGITVPNDGAPTVGPAWTGNLPMAMAWEFLATLAIYLTVAYSFGLRKIHCFYQKIAKRFIDVEIGNMSVEHEKRLQLWKQKGHALNHMSPSVFGGSLAVAGVTGVVSMIGYTITLSGYDFFVFLWAALYTGLLTNYPAWWIYFVGNLLAWVGTFIFYWFGIRAVHASYETTKANYRAKLQYVLATTEWYPTTVSEVELVPQE